MSLEIETMRADPNRRIIISTPKGTVNGFITAEFSVAGGANFDSHDQSSAMGKVNNLVNTVSGIVNTVSDVGMSQTRVTSLKDTASSWTSSKPLDFSINLIFVAIEDEDDVRQDVRTLLQGVYPTRELGGTLLTAPGGYRLDAVGRASNTCVLSIGNWFRAADLILTDVQAQFSKEILPSGLPLYCNVTISMAPYRTPSADEVVGYLE